MTNWPIRGKAPLRNIRKDWERAVERSEEVDALITGRCMVPPQGWLCTRTPGHDGPCAAHPVHVNSEADLNPAEWMLLADLMHRAFALSSHEAPERQLASSPQGNPHPDERNADA